MEDPELKGISHVHEAHYLEQVRKIVLESAEGLDCRIFLFGSRVTGNIKRTSDFDIGIEGLNRQEFLKLRLRIDNAVQESNILHSVDVVDFSSADDQFVQVAGKHKTVWKVS